MFIYLVSIKPKIITPLKVDNRNKLWKDYFSLQNWELYKPASSCLEKSPISDLWCNPWKKKVYLLIYLLIFCLLISLSRMSIFNADFFLENMLFLSLCHTFFWRLWKHLFQLNISQWLLLKALFNLLMNNVPKWSDTL